MEIKTKQ